MNAPAPSRAPVVLVIEDEWIVARDVQQILVGGGYDVPRIVVRASDVESALDSVDPDLALVDVSLNGAPQGIELAAMLRARRVPVVFVSAYSDSATLLAARAQFPAGYVVKPFTPSQLLAAVAIGLAGRASPRPVGELPGMQNLTPREHEVLRLLLAHKRPPAIARALVISPFTVRNHLKSIFAKLGVGSQQELLDALLGPTAP